MLRTLFYLAAATLIACGSDAPATSDATPEIPASVDRDLVVCQTDDDCVAVPAGCCDCYRGGTATAVNKSSRLRWNQHRTQECSPTCCDHEPSGDATCAAAPVCENGECKLR